MERLGKTHRQIWKARKSKHGKFIYHRKDVKYEKMQHISFLYSQQAPCTGYMSWAMLCTALLSAWMVQERGKAGKNLETGKFLRVKNRFLPGDLWAHHLPFYKRRSHIACAAGRSLQVMVAQH